MSQKIAVQPEKKNATPVLSGLLQHAAVRSIPEHSRVPVPHPESSFSYDLSRIRTRRTPSANGTARSISCPLFPRTCPFGGACHTCPVKVQAKLKVNQPGDKYEREADRVAEQVKRISESHTTQDVDALRRDQNGYPKLQRSVADHARTPPVPPIVSEVLRSPGQPLDRAVRAFMEPRFGQDFGRVRVHTDDKAVESTRAVNARAYTIGRDIVFDETYYSPGTSSGRRLLAHELTHIVQQAGHRIPEASFVQRDEEDDAKPASQMTCNMTAKRESTGTGFCIDGTTNATDGTRVSFYYISGMTSCNRGDLSIMPPFGTTTVSSGRFSWRAPTNLGSPIPGVGRLFGAIIGSAVCCTRPRPGRC